jgi:hypothetical protein
VDLAADPLESVDVSVDHPDIVRALDAALDQERARLGDTPIGSVGEAVKALGYAE